MQSASLNGTNYWDARGRTIVFLLASSSIACLMADFYGLCPMHLFTPLIFLPAVVALLAFAALDRVKGNGQLWRAVLAGLLAGLLAAVAYDIFRLPFVFAREWHLTTVIPPMNLFKAFPRFGAMVLGQPVEQAEYSLFTQIVGWLYHFSNGATFGVMYLALVGDAAKRRWCWAVLFALVLEMGMLLTPYPRIFDIPLTLHFLVVTASAHAIFGVGLGISVRRIAGMFVPPIVVKA